MSRNRRLGDVDVAVIGAGVAGSTAAALLAERGYRVAVLERDVHPGGCAASFEHDGYSFAVGATVAMGLEPGGLLRTLYDRLGLEPRYVEVSPAIRVHLPDRTVEIATERGAWQRELARAFPGRDDAKIAFWDEVARLAALMHQISSRFPVLPFRRPVDLLDSLRSVRPGMLRGALPLLSGLRRTVRDRLEHYGIEDDAHAAFIDGQLIDAMQTTAESCVAANGAFALDVYRYGCQYKIGGLQTIARDLLASARASGAEIHYATRVRRIHHDDGRVLGLDTSRGPLGARAVVSAIPIANTADLLARPEASTLAARGDDAPPMWGAFTLYLGVDERCLPVDVRPFEQVTDLGRYHDGGNLLISTSPRWDRSRAPQGKRAVTVSTHVEAGRWLDLARDPHAYDAAKRRLEGHLLDQIERAMPDIRRGIEVKMSGTPRTFERFTLRARGAVGGLPQTLAAANFSAPSHHTDIAGLFLAGDTVFPGQGTLGVAVSGHNAARSAARALSRWARPAPHHPAPQPKSMALRQGAKEVSR